MARNNQQDMKPQAYYVRKKQTEYVVPGIIPWESQQKMTPQAYYARKKQPENESLELLCQDKTNRKLSPRLIMQGKKTTEN